MIMKRCRRLNMQSDRSSRRSWRSIQSSLNLSKTMWDGDQYIYKLDTNIYRKYQFFLKLTLSHLNDNSLKFSFSVTTKAIIMSIRQRLSLLELWLWHSLDFSLTFFVYHRLPKLDLPKFDNNIVDWQSFWDSYEAFTERCAKINLKRLWVEKLCKV